MLPLVLIEDILLRLSVKVLFRLRCVCKPWCDLIANPSFTLLHFNRSIKQGPSSILLTSSNSVLNLDPENPNQVVNMDQPSLFSNAMFCFGSCNGLVCALDNDMKTILVLNPSTRKHMEITPTPGIPTDFHMRTRGFFYDPISRDYRIIYITKYFHGGSTIGMMFMFRENTWKKIENVPNKNFGSELGQLVNGMVHWLCYTWTPYDYEQYLFAYDPAGRKFVEVPKPLDSEEDTTGIIVGYTVLGGCLSIFRGHGSTHCEVLVMKDYGVQESWRRMFVFESPDKGSYHMPLMYMTEKGNLLFQSHRLGLYVYDKEKDTVEKIQNAKEQIGSQFMAIPYVDSFQWF